MQPTVQFQTTTPTRQPILQTLAYIPSKYRNTKYTNIITIYTIYTIIIHYHTRLQVQILVVGNIPQ